MTTLSKINHILFNVYITLLKLTVVHDPTESFCDLYQNHFS